MKLNAALVRLGLRLAVSGGRVAVLRTVFTVVGVAIGVALILLVMAAQAAVQGREDRTGWRSANVATIPTAPDHALVLTVTDYYRGQPMTRAYVATLGPNPPVPPGLHRLPAPGEVAVSPAMGRLLAVAPDDELDNRFPGRVDMTIGDAGLAYADELVAIVGMTPDELGNVRSVETVRGFAALSDGFVYYVFFRLFLVLGAVLLLAPIGIFIAMATRIAAAQREQRLAAIRLVGASQGQIAVVAMAETGVAVLAGLVLGWVAYAVGLRALVATVTFQGGHFYGEDAVASPLALAAVCLGVLALTLAATVVSLSRIQLGPLGIVRRSRRSVSGRQHALRAAPLVIGLIGLIGVFPAISGLARLFGTTFGESIVLILLSILLVPISLLMTLVGLVVAGPWLCTLAAGAMARLSRRASALIAARRIAVDPWAAFRAVSGVVVAAFALTFFSTLAGDDEPPTPQRLQSERPGVVTVFTGAVPQEAVEPLLTPGAVIVRFRSELDGLTEDWDWLVRCEDMRRVAEVTCPYPPDDGFEEPDGPVDDLLVGYVYIPTDGSAAAQERIRTVAAVAVPNAIINADGDPTNLEARFNEDLFRVFQVFCLAVLLVAAVSLAAGMVGAVIERQRSFALLRVSGVPISRLRGVVLLETVVPMVLTSVVGAVLGLLSAAALVAAQSGEWRWPDLTSMAIIGGGILAALLAPLLVLPLLTVATRPETVRYE